jgi:kumamolisin
MKAKKVIVTQPQVELPGSFRSLRLGARRSAAVRPDEKVTVTVRLRRRQRRSDAKRLLTVDEWYSVYRASKVTRRSLSRSAFTASFGAGEADLDVLVDFAKRSGLSVDSVSISRRNVVLTGPAELIQAAFGAEMAYYELDAEIYRGREGSIFVPRSIMHVIDGVFGLDTRRMARRSSDTTVGAALTPPNVAQLYSFPNSGDASGQMIGCLEFGSSGYRPVDVQNYFNAPGFRTPHVVDVGINGSSNVPGVNRQADAEVIADICVAGSVAQGADIAVYFSTWDEQGWVQAISTAVHPDPGQPAPTVLSISWVWPELVAAFTPDVFQWSAAAIKAVSDTLQEAAMLTESVTVLAATGDWGSDGGVGDTRAHVCYPASDPWVTACGGTTIRSVVGLAPSEQTWSQPAGATGGGISGVFQLPSWQAQTGVPKSANDNRSIGRGIPDVAGNVGPYVFLLNGITTTVGGTSVATPLYAALVALINAALGKRLGFLNPLLYTTEDPTVFRDIADGVSNSFRDAVGYTSGPGWDACTGLGVVNGIQLLNAARKRLGNG